MHVAVISTSYMLYFLRLLNSQLHKNYRFTSQHLYFCKNMHKQMRLCTVLVIFFLDAVQRLFSVCLFVCCCLFKVYQSSTLVSARSVRTSSILLESWLCKLLFWFQFFVCSCFHFFRIFYVLFCFGNSLFFLVLFHTARSYCSTLFRLTYERTFVRNEEWNSVRSLTQSVYQRCIS